MPLAVDAATSNNPQTLARQGVHTIILGETMRYLSEMLQAMLFAGLIALPFVLYFAWMKP